MFSGFGASAWFGGFHRSACFLAWLLPITFDHADDYLWLILRMRGNKLLQFCCCGALNTLAEQWRPPQQNASHAKRLPTPTPKVETIVMPHDLAISECDVGPNAIMYFPACKREGVLSLPQRLPGLLVGGNSPKINGEVSAFAEHVPHGPDLFALQVKDGIIKHGIGMVTPNHRGIILLLERLVKGC
jgi:hypothetical protein